jgi:hypothetical protein
VAGGASADLCGWWRSTGRAGMAGSDLPSLEQPRGDGERGRQPRGDGDGGVGPSFLGAAARRWRERADLPWWPPREESGGGDSGIRVSFLEQSRGDSDGGVGPSMMAAERGKRGRGWCHGGIRLSFMGAAAWAADWSELAGLAVGRRERGGERERVTAGRTVHQNVCTSTLMSYRVVKIW